MRTDRRNKDDTIRSGDQALYAWGQSVLNGDLEALMHARSGGLGDRGPVIRAPGTHSNPPLSLLLTAERHKLTLALSVDNIVEQWRTKRDTALFAAIADSLYAAPYKMTNEETAQVMGVSERTIKGARSQMRRSVLLSLRLAGNRDVE